MKTKHKLKILKTLSCCSSEFEQLSKLLYLEAISNPTFTVKIESIEGTKPEPITEIFEVGDHLEITCKRSNFKYIGAEIGDTFEVLEVIGNNYMIRAKPIKSSFTSDYLLLYRDEAKKIPIQKDNPKEFKVGDKVRVIKGENITKHFFNDGDTVVINELEDNPTYGLCAYCNGDRTNQWVSIKELEHI